MVRSGRNSVRAFRYHTGFGYFVRNLHTGQVSADTGLCALSHFDFDSRARIEITLEYTETSRSYLTNGILAVFVEVLVQTALTGIIISAEFFCGSGKTFVRVFGNRTERHRREHCRNVKFEIRCFFIMRLAIRVVGNFLRLFSEERFCFHRLTKRVNRRVCYLRSVKQNFVPINGIFFRVAHCGEQNTAAFCLLVYFVHCLMRPVTVRAELVFVRTDFQRVSRAKAYAPLTVNARHRIGYHFIEIWIVFMNFISALAFANAALYTSVGISYNLEKRIHIIYCHVITPFLARLYPKLR